MADATTTTALERRFVYAAVLACLVLLNVVGLGLFGRLDWTHDKEFTLSPASQRALQALQEPVTVRAYFSRDLPPPHASQARYVKDLLDTFYAQARGKIRFEFIDPTQVASSEETDRKNQLRQDVFGNTVREATAMERELESIGIPPVQVRVNQADKLEVKRAYMGLAFTAGSRREVLPVVTETQGLEYDITSMLKKFAQQKPQKLALVGGHGGDGGTRPSEEMTRGLAALREHYDVGEVDLTQAGTQLPDADAVLVLGPQTPLTAAEQDTLRAYLHAGHPVGLFLPPAKANLQGLTSRDNDHGLDAFLAELGVRVGSELVLDAHCATINVQKQQGFMRINQPVRYPFVAEHDQLATHPVTRGLGGVLLPFAAPVTWVGPAAGSDVAATVRHDVWARSSDQSWLQPRPYNLEPLQRWLPERGALGAHDLMLALEGPLGRLPANAAGDANAAATPAASTRVVVAGSDALFADPFLGKANEALLLNVVDWLVGDDDLLAVRSRGMAALPLQEVGEARRRSVKYGNVVGLPLAFVGLGLVRWRRRERRRATVHLSSL